MSDKPKFFAGTIRYQDPLGMSAQKQMSFDRVERSLLTMYPQIGVEFISGLGLGVTGMQFVILRLLQDDGPQTVNRLASTLCVKPSAVTGMVDRLLKRGWVQRQRDEEDRRVVHIELSIKGQQITQEVSAARTKKLQELFQSITAEEMKTWARICEKLDLVLNE